MSAFEDVNQALVEAINNDDINTVRQLLNTSEVNCNLEQELPNYRKGTILMHAIRKGNYDIVELLFIQYWCRC